MRLFELAAAGAAPVRSNALGPIELIARWPDRLRVRHAEDAMAELVAGWGAIPASCRPLTCGLTRDRWLRVAARAAASPDPRSRLNAARFAEDTADPGLGAMLCLLLRDPEQTVRLHADRALLRLAMTMLTHIPDALLGPEFGRIADRTTVPLAAEPGLLNLERVELCRQISDACWTFAEHRCRAPLVAALLILDRVPGGTMERAVAARIRRLLNESAHPSHSPIRTVLRRTPSPLLRERALRWIVVDPIRSTCIDRLASADSPEEHEITLRRAYLAIRAKRGTRLRAVRPLGEREQAPTPDARTLAGLSPQARLGMVRFVQLIGLEDDARRVALEPTLADADPLVRLAGAHAAHPADLGDYAFDTDEAIARSAATRWSTLGVVAPLADSAPWIRRTQTAGLLARSPHHEVRAIAKAERDRLDPFAGTPAARLAARRLFEKDPVAFVRLVRDRLADDGSVLHALMLVRFMRLAPRFEMDLLDLATTAPNDRVRATAVAALGVCITDTARRVVRASLNAPDQRVRSNAIEAVDAGDPVLLEYKEDGSHRVRASAVRRLLATDNADQPGASARDAAAESLARMLTDDRPEHRLSGAWAAERTLLPERRDTIGLGWRAAARRVIDAADQDPDPRVRLRASRCARRMQAVPAGMAS
jgi:hypothetical protein